MKAGTNVNVKFIRPEGDVTEQATVCRVTAMMLPLPAGYLPVRFAADGAVALVHASYITAA